MPFNEDTGKLLLSHYSQELNYLDNVRMVLESKANTQMQTSGMILGLYGAVSAIFLVSFNAVLSVYPFLLLLYYISIIITIFFIFCSLLLSLLTIRIKKWKRPMKVIAHSKDKFAMIRYAIEDSSVNEKKMVERLLLKTANSIAIYHDNNLKMRKTVIYSFYCLLLGLIGFISSVIILISVGIFAL